MIAGPSEVMVLADETADPKYVAADLMSQAEHDVMASAILVTTCPELAEKVQAEVNRQVQYLSRKEIIEKSMNEYGAVLLCNSREEAAQLANMVAPEHLEVLMENPMELLGALDNVGSLFLGAYASEPLGDYYAGPTTFCPPAERHGSSRRWACRALPSVPAIPTIPEMLCGKPRMTLC